MFIMREGESLCIPAGVDGDEVLAGIEVRVPGRTCGRTKAHREQFCIVALLKALRIRLPAFFPATLRKGEAPDFLIWSHPLSAGLAFEHTDFGSEEFQAKLTKEAVEARKAAQGDDPFRRGIIHDSNDGLVGDEPERRWEADLLEAARRKADPKFWRNKPPDHQAWLLAYDMSETSVFVSDGDAQDALLKVLSDVQARATTLHGIALVRGDDCVLWGASGRECP